MTDAVVESRPAPAHRPRSKRARAGSGFEQAPRYAFWLLIVFLVLEYARPPVVVHLKLQMLITLVLPLVFLSAKRRPWSLVLTLQAVFFVWCVKSIPFAYNWFAVYFTARTLYGYIAVAMGLVWVCSNLKDLRTVLWVYVAIMVYQALWGLAYGGRGTGGFLGEENDLALACITAFPFAFYGFERLKGRTRLLSGLAMAVLIASIVGTMSRGGFIGLVCCATYCWMTSRHKIRAIVVVLIAVILIPIFAPPTYIDEIRSISQTNSGTAKGRRFLWESAFNMWVAHPILGVGGGNSTYLIGRYQPTDFEEREYNERDWSGTTVHSLYFQLLPEQGIVGMGLFSYLVWFHFRSNRRLIRGVGRSKKVPPVIRRDAALYAHALNASLIGYLTAGAFLSVAYYPYLWYLTALSAALDLAIRGELRRAAARRAARQHVPS